MIRWWLAEIGLVALWVLIACAPTSTTVWSCVVAIALGLVALGLPQPRGQVDQFCKTEWCWVAGLFVLLGTQMVPDTLVIVSGVIGLIVFAAHAEQTFRPPAQVAWSGLVTLLACAMVAFVARLPLLVRSSKPIEPGQLTFLLYLTIWFVLLTGIVTHHKQQDPSKRDQRLPGVSRFIWSRRHAVFLTIVGSFQLVSTLV